MKARLARVAGLVLALAASVALGDDLVRARQLLRDGAFAEAATALVPLTEAESEGRDEALFLRARALSLAGEHEAAAEVAARLEAELPDSPWYYKARFLHAQSLAERKDYRGAEAIYAEEANRLLAGERKERIARVVVDLADRLAQAPEVQALDAPQPDYAKAYRLYNLALTLEIDRSVRDELMFKKARALQLAGNHHGAVQDYRNYLQAFDPRWSGPSGAAPAMLQPPPAGRFWREARFHLAQSLLAGNQHEHARWEAENLLTLLLDEEEPAADLLADLRWLLVLAERLPQPDANRIEFALAAARGFLERHANDPRAVKAAWLIPQTLEHHGRADEAVAAYREFIADVGFHLPADEAAHARHPDLAASPSEARAEWRQHALYRMGRLRFQQRDYPEAIEYWRQYVNQYPSGRDWAASQTGIVDARFQQGVKALEDKRHEAARQVFDDFLREYPLDPRAPSILFAFGQIHYARALDLKQEGGEADALAETWRRAIDEWQHLIGRFGDSQEASLAQYRSGLIYEEDLRDFAKALHTYRGIVQGAYAGQARQRIAMMTGKSLEIETERTFRSHETPVVKVATRNIETLTVRLYRLDLEAYFRKMHGIGEVEKLDVGLIEPDRTWTVEIADYQAYMPSETRLEIPFDDARPGAAVVSVGDETTWQATTLVLRSDLELIFKASRREALVLVQDKVADRVVPDVRVLLSDGTGVFATGLTGADGVWQGTADQLDSLDRVRVLAMRNGHAAAFNLDLSGLKTSRGLVPKGYIYTDRPAYRPGETVACRGILRDVVDGEYAIPDPGRFNLRVSDNAGRLLREEEVELSPYGSFNLEFALSDGAALGDYTIEAQGRRENQPDLVFHGGFKVQHFQLEKIRLDLTFPESVYFRGETIVATLKAEYYWGEPLREAPVLYSLPDGRRLRGLTDAKGELTFSFETTGMAPGSMLAFEASLEGENVSLRRALPLARLGFEASVKVNQETVLAGEPFEVTVDTRAANGDPTGVDMTLYVLRREIRQVNPYLDTLPGIASAQPPIAEVTVQEHRLQTDPETGLARLMVTLEKGGDYRLRVAGEDRFGQTVTAVGAIQVSDDDDATRLRWFADSETLNVGETARLRLHSRAPAGLALITHEGETILDYRVIRLEEGFNPLDFEVAHRHFPNLRLAAAMIDGRQVRTAHREFTVQRRLRVAIRPVRDHYPPGAPGQVELTVTDQLGRPVVAELSLALVDQALLAVHPDETPDILDFFQSAARRHAEFRTGGSCGFAYKGVTEPVAAAEVAERERRVREREEARQMVDARSALSMEFAARKSEAVPGDRKQAEMPAPSEALLARPMAPEMSLEEGGRATSSVQSAPSPPPEPRREIPGRGVWLPSVITDADGQATVDIPMPEKTTEWRLASRGCTPETLVGQAFSQVLTRQDFFVSLKTPDFIREGDELSIVGRAHNLTQATGMATLHLAIAAGEDGERSVGTQQLEVEVPAEGGVEIAFRPFLAPPELELSLTLTAEFGDHRDSLQTTLTVVPWGMDYAAHEGGASNLDATVLLALPENPPCERQWMTVAVGPDMQRALVDMALRQDPTPRQRLIAPTPFGVTPADQLLAAISALDYARRLATPDEDARQLERRVRGLIASLVASQRDDGGWSWHPGASRHSDWATASRTYWALVATRNRGFAVHPETIAKTAAFLNDQFRRFGATDNEAKAVVLHALSVDKQADFANVNRLYRERNQLGAAALAYTALAFANLNRPEIARELNELLLGKAETSERDGVKRVHWSHGAQHPRLQHDPETTALVLLSLSHTHPRAEAGRAAAEWLIRQWGVSGVGVGQARGATLAALAAWFADAAGERADFELTVRVNDRELTTFRSREEFRRRTVDVPEEWLQPGENRVEFRKRGAGTFSYAASLHGFSRTIQDPKSFAYPHVRHRRTYHEGLSYRGRPLGATSSQQIRKLAIGQRTRVRIDLYNSTFTGYMMIEEPLPAGAILVADSVKGRFVHHDVHRDRIVFYYPPNTSPDSEIQYELVGYAPGVYRVPPTAIRDAVHPGRMRLGNETELVVLGSGEVSDEAYVMNHAELFALGRAYFNDGLYADALEHLSELFRQRQNYNERDLAHMLLWILTAPDFYEPRRIVEMFEILRERHPELEIPFDKILTIGRAYRDIGEFERAWLIYRATIAASFVSDSNVSAMLEDEGRFMASIDYQAELWLEYPDGADVVASWFALTQALYQKAPQAHTLPEVNGIKPNRVAMLRRVVDMLGDFLAFHPTDPLADDAAFSLTNAFLDLRDYPMVVALSHRFATRFADSQIASSFQYMAALGWFWQGEYRQALDAARQVAEGQTRDRNFARYIVGQIHHAHDEPAAAIEWYRKVAENYPDAAQAIDYFESRSVALEEVNVFRPGEAVALNLRHRNVKDAFLQVYRVDLMKLYLREKNLSRITAIHLAGIAPSLETTVELGDGKDYRDRETSLELALKEEGAYLVICRGDDLFTSALVLITPLDIEVQEYPDSGRLRVNVIDAVAGGYRANVQVKAIGSQDSEFRDGQTDLRGIFVADNLRGQVTVIAREDDARYAFHRGETWFGPRPDERRPTPTPSEQPDLDFQENLRQRNFDMQRMNIEQFDQNRRGTQRGVQVKEAF